MKGKRFSKGFAFSTLIIFFVTIAVIAGSIISYFITSETISEEIQFNVGDQNVLKEMKVRHQNYEMRMPNALNYSINTASIWIGDKGGSYQGTNIWDDNIPSITVLEDNYMSELEDTYSFRNRVGGECQPPQIDQISKVQKVYTVDFSEGIVCEGENTEVTKQVEPINYENNLNRYMDLAGHAIKLAESAREVSPDEIDEEGSASDCGSSTDAREGAKSSARSNAESEAPSAFEPINEVEDDEPDEVSVSGSVDITGSNYGTTQTDTRDCCNEFNDDGDCVDPDTRYYYESNFNVDEIEFDFSITDQKHDLMTRNGFETIVFDFMFVNDI